MFHPASHISEQALPPRAWLEPANRPTMPPRAHPYDPDQVTLPEFFRSRVYLIREIPSMTRSVQRMARLLRGVDENLRRDAGAIAVGLQQIRAVVPERTNLECVRISRVIHETIHGLTTRIEELTEDVDTCLLYTSPSPRD